jgi:hypothetical protein
MKSKHGWSAIALMAGAILGLASPAAAQTFTIPIPNAVTIIGNLGNQTKIASMAPNGNCTIVNVNGAGQGLTANTTFQDAAFSNGWILVADQNHSWCGLTLGPIDHNNWRITLSGRSGDDLLTTSALFLHVINGGDGLDNLSHEGGSGTVTGGSGNNNMTAGPGSRFTGGSSVDRACGTQGATTSLVAVTGGLGADVHCGNPSTLSSSTLNCATACGF